MMRSHSLVALLAMAVAPAVASAQTPPDNEVGAAPVRPHISARAVLPRDLMSREERAIFRAEMERATPEQRIALWNLERAVLQQRATALGVGLAVPTMRADGTFAHIESPENWPGRPVRWVPLAP